MTELEKLQRAKMYLDKLANGIDPTTDSEVPDDSALNNIRLSRCFFYVSDVLRQVIENGGAVKPVKRSEKEDFVFAASCREALQYSKEPLQISKFVERINGCIDTDRMKKLTTVAVTDWLLGKGFLTQVTNENGRKNREPTPLGHKIGLSDVARQGQYGEYKAVFYNEDAQRFLIDHIDEIIESRRGKRPEQ